MLVKFSPRWPHRQVRNCCHFKVAGHDLVVVVHGVIEMKSAEHELDKGGEALLVMETDDLQVAVKDVYCRLKKHRLDLVALVSRRFLFVVVAAIGRVIREDAVRVV
jgi:hypothetical protein